MSKDYFNEEHNHTSLTPASLNSIKWTPHWLLNMKRFCHPKIFKFVLGSQYSVHSSF